MWVNFHFMLIYSPACSTCLFSWYGLLITVGGDFSQTQVVALIFDIKKSLELAFAHVLYAYCVNLIFQSMLRRQGIGFTKFRVHNPSGHFDIM